MSRKGGWGSFVDGSVSVAVVLPVAVLSGCLSTPQNGPVGGGSADANVGSDSSVGSDASTPKPDASTGGDASSGGCASGWLMGPAGNCVLNLQGGWAPSTDANNNGPDTVATIGTVTPTSVSVVQSHTGTSGADCGCNSQHLNIPLGKTFSCASSTLEFEFATTTTITATNTPALNIRFCTGDCPAIDGGIGGPSWYSGAQYVGSPAAPATSICAYEWENDAGTGSLNYFPASAKITSGATTTVPLATYSAPTSSDMCTGSFDTIDIHMQVYNCFATETGTNTLSNVRIY